jgi:hypothetical protein
VNLFSFKISADSALHVEFGWLLVVLAGAVLVYVFISRIYRFWNTSYLVVDEAEIGFGANKVKLKANLDDLQIGFKFWTEIMTRKVGLPFDEQHDVIVEVYDSWYQFFGISRELIKSIPVSKIRTNESTKEIVLISVHILNNELRPHLTKWQAKFRKWWLAELAKDTNAAISPQDLQRRYPHYAEMIAEIKSVNSRLVKFAQYLQKMVGV